MNVQRIKAQASRCGATFDLVKKDIDSLNRVPHQVLSTDASYYNRTNTQVVRRAADKVSSLLFELEYLRRLLTE